MGHDRMTNADWLALDRRYRIQTRYTAPMVLARGQGVSVWDAEGKEYLDFESGQVCTVTGHCHPALVGALSRQAATLMQTGSAFTDIPQILLAERLAKITPDPFEKSFFAATGSESNEAALRIAKLYTGRFEVAALVRGYHGITLGSYSVTGFGGAFRDGYGPAVPGVTFLPPPYEYRCLFCRQTGQCNLGCVEYSEELLDRTTSGRLAAVILEIIMSAGGMITPPVKYLQAIREMCDRRGALLIVDEAQSGLGRTGKWFAFEHYGILPDLITVSKSLGGGIPLSAVTTTRAIAEAVEEKGYYQSSSHTGDPLLAAVGLANIEIIERENLLQNVVEMGEYLRRRLDDLQARYDIVGQVRGKGLMQGVEIVEDKGSRKAFPDGAREVTRYCRDHGCLIGYSLGKVGGDAIRLLPPYVVTRAQIDRLIETFEAGTRSAMELLAKRT